MKRITAKFLGAFWLLGPGASAMAGPGHDQDCPDQAAPRDQDQEDREDAQSQAPPPGGAQAPAPGQAQAGGQDQPQDTAETFAWSTGPSHLGVLVMGMTPELRQHLGAPADRGVLIAKIEPRSPAERAGLQVGDVIVRVGTQRVRTGDDVIQALSAQSAGRVRLTVIRQGREVRIDAMLPGREQPKPPSPQSQL